MAIQKKSTWLFCLTLSLLYAVIVNAYYLYPFSRVLEQAGWGDKLHWIEFSFEAGTLLGMVVLIPLTIWHFPTKLPMYHICLGIARRDAGDRLFDRVSSTCAVATDQLACHDRYLCSDLVPSLSRFLSLGNLAKGEQNQL
ncbi:hypothetical protein [Shimazuella alba]|uniref:Uncharacterized protein n=1 Tax=Shimazuella alba TaxID=2690964 RepID=A0A6I4VS20_9BACL|nr:hypothetical protein [Shimazuella alba]MXQ53813.1 hypothetical protein [Shimazuella alba]